MSAQPEPRDISIAGCLFYKAMQALSTQEEQEWWKGVSLSKTPRGVDQALRFAIHKYGIGNCFDTP